MEFNTRRGLFTDARLRRAAAYAIDRKELAAVRGNSATGQYLPPGTPGYRKISIYPLRPDVQKARALAPSGSQAAVLYSCERPDCLGHARILKANLAKIGIRVETKAFEDPFTEAFKPGAKWDLLMSGWGLDWPDPSGVFDALVADVGFRPSWAPPPALSVRRVDAELTRAERLLPPGRYAAYARIERRLLRDEVPLAPYESSVLPEFFSSRMGCKVFQPVYGAVDIGALCVRKS